MRAAVVELRQAVQNGAAPRGEQLVFVSSFREALCQGNCGLARSPRGSTVRWKCSTTDVRPGEWYEIS